MKARLKGHPLSMVLLMGALGLGGCAERKAREELSSARKMATPKEASDVHYSLCVLDGAQQIALEEAAKVKKGDDAGMLRYALTSALLCVARANAERGDAEASRVMLPTLTRLFDEEPSAQARGSMIFSWMLRRDDPVLGYALQAHAVRHATPEQLKAFPAMGFGPLTTTDKPEDAKAREARRAQWCETVAPALHERFVRPAAQLGAARRPMDLLDGSQVARQIIHHTCDGLALKVWRESWAASRLLKVRDAVFAHEQARGRDAFTSAVLAERVEDGHFTEEYAAQLAPIMKGVGDEKKPLRDRYRAYYWNVRSNVQTNWFFAFRTARMNPERAAPLFTAFFEAPRSCVAWHLLTYHLLREENEAWRDRRGPALKLRDHVRAQLERCPRALVGFPPDTELKLRRWLGDGKAEATRVRMGTVDVFALVKGDAKDGAKDGAKGEPKKRASGVKR